jgi:NAD(P)H-dependent FMN reductase
MANVLFLVGSLREGAFSAELAKSAEKALEGKATVSYLDWKDVPVFSQDLEADAPAAVKAARPVLAADAIWIFSPVYNAGIPGSVRNLLDWLSRALDLSDTTGVSAINEKVVTVSISSFAHQDEAAVEYRKLLPFIRTSLVDEFTLATIGAPVDEAQLAKQADALLAAIN